MSEAVPGDALLTFAIPYYSHPDYLWEALDSVLAQANPRWRVDIHVDNPRQPPERRRLAGYLDDPRIHCHINRHNLGLAANWNRCLDCCATPLLTILHADDRLLPEYTDLALSQFAGDDGAWAVFCHAAVIDAAGVRTWSPVDAAKHLFRPRDEAFRLHGEEGARALLAGNFIMCPTLCYRMERVGSLRFSTELQMVADLDFYLRLLMAGGALRGSREVAYEYRRHGDSQTARLTRSLRRFEEELALYRRTADALEGQGWRGAADTARRARVIRAHLAARAAIDVACLRWRRARDSLRLALDG